MARRRGDTHPEPDELNGARTETKSSDTCENTNEPHGVSVELEPSRLGEQHRAHEGPFRCVKTYEHQSACDLTILQVPVLTSAHHQTQRGRPRTSIRSQRAPYTNDTGASIQEAFRHVARDVQAILPSSKVVALHGYLSDGNTLAGQHALVDDSVSGEKEYVCRESGEWRLNEVDDVARHDLRGVAL